MKIGLIGPTYPYKGGISHYNTTLCNELSKKHDIFLISYKMQYPSLLYPGKGQIDRESTIKLNKTISIEYIIHTINPLTWIETYFKIKKESPDLVIFQWVHPFLTFVFFTITKLLKKFTNVKILYICHDVLPHERTKIDKFLIKIAFKGADYFIVHSKEDYDNLIKITSNAKVKQSILPKYDIFNIKKQEIKNSSLAYNSKNYMQLKKDAQKYLSIKENKKIILFFGIIREYKGLMYLIKAIPKIINKIDVCFLIAGEFWDDKNKYVNEIKKLGIENYIKIFDTYIPDKEVGMYFSVADVVVLPYVSATQSGIVQIAYSFEKPVIITNVGGLPDVVDHGKTGIIVESENSEELANAIIDYFNNDKEREFVENIKIKNKEFSWDILIKDIEDLIACPYTEESIQ
ncbi:MAG: glycosyltransferase family 4 protein [Methanosarcinales archaeon]|nr:glycosyltransferase family 4 protein [Methanosarcinales archaeon]